MWVSLSKASVDAIGFFYVALGDKGGCELNFAKSPPIASII